MVTNDGENLWTKYEPEQNQQKQSANEIYIHLCVSLRSFSSLLQISRTLAFKIILHSQVTQKPFWFWLPVVFFPSPGSGQRRNAWWGILSRFNIPGNQSGINRKPGMNFCNETETKNNEWEQTIIPKNKIHIRVDSSHSHVTVSSCFDRGNSNCHGNTNKWI